jgi:hypothetical protein
MSLAIRAFFEPMKTLAFGSISGTYAAVGSGLLHPARVLIFQNQTNATVTFSLDGINDHFPLLSNGYFVLDVSANKDASSYGLYFATGTVIYVKGTPGSGSVTVSAVYGDQL